MAEFKKGDKKIYDQIYEGISFYQTVGEVYHTARSKKKVTNFYLDAIKNIEAPKVLDLGCYIGTELFMLPKVKEKAQYYGLDISEGVIEYAKALAEKRGEKNMTFKSHDANKPIPFEDNFFDVIISLELLEHVEDPIEVLKEIKRVLKPGGCLIMSTPNDATFMNNFYKLLPKSFESTLKNSRQKDFDRHGNNFDVDHEVWDDDAHISLFSFNTWKELIERSGLKLTGVEGSSFFGGSRFISNKPFLLGTAIILDSIIDKLPLKPHFQMCMVLRAQKTE